LTSIGSFISFLGLFDANPSVSIHLQLLPVPVISAVYLGQFYNSRSLLSYAVFTAGGAACAAWFIVRHFWSIQAVLGDHPVKETSRILMLGVVLALALPGVASAGPKGKVALGALMAAQGLVVCMVEDRLYGHAHEGRQCQRI
jgi:hypothetical protein